MPTHKRTILCLSAAIWSIAACDSASEGTPAALPPTEPAPASAAPVQPSAANTAGGTTTPAATSTAKPTNTASMPSSGAAQPSAAPQPAAAPAAPAGDPAATAAEPDACSERKVSYTKPCHNNPDPCGLKTQYPGDEYCMPAPSEAEGLQIHIGPDDHTDEAEVAKYLIQPGEEFNNSVIGHIPLGDTEKWWDRITVQMRPGSHHWISPVVDGLPEEKFYDDTGCGGASQIGSIGGGQNLIYDNPPQGIPAPENVGLGRSITGNSSLCMNLHAYNFTDKPQLREVWVNLRFVDEEKVTQKAAGIAMVGGLGLNLAPGQNTTLTYEGSFSGDGRIIQLFGHRHVWTPRFAVWLNDDLIYDSWSWEESVTYNYDSLTMNPPINTAGMEDGGASGVLEAKAGDTLKFSCFIENKSENTLQFSNELYGGEMCNLWGSTVGSGVAGTYF